MTKKPFGARDGKNIFSRYRRDFIRCVIPLSIAVNIVACAGPAGERLVVDPAPGQEDAREIQLVARIREFYTDFENNDWGKMYTMTLLSLELARPDAKSKFIEFMETQTPYGPIRWRFASLELKEMIIRENKAYVAIEYSLTDKESRETFPKSTWWDEWVFRDGNWLIECFLTDGIRPDHWPQ